VSTRPGNPPGTGTSPAHSPGTALVGRADELSRLHALADPELAAGRLLVVAGDAGMGKSALLADAAGHARSAGLTVLTATGRESEARLPFAGLHQLLRPALAGIADLPDRQRHALAATFGVAGDPVEPDQLITSIAVLTLLSDLTEDAPLFLVADDAQWLDRSSLDVLAFIGHRLGTERIIALMGWRGPAAGDPLDRDFAQLRLGPLTTADATRLLDQQPEAPRGRARAAVLAQAAGNPMALIELSKVVVADPAAGRRGAAEPLPLTDRLAAVLADRLATLPRPTRDALLLAAAADGPDLVTAMSGGPEPPAEVLAPAEQLGLVRVDTAGVHFTHPLARSASYHSVPFADRAAAHRQLAGLLADQPDRRAWHLAAASIEPDEQVAALLADTAAQDQQRGGSPAAALALERAAELSPDLGDRARRLVGAAGIAYLTGQPDWTQDLAARALALTREPRLRCAALQLQGWALAMSRRHAAALTPLILAAREASAELPELAWTALASAALVCYQAGDPRSRSAVSAALAELRRLLPLHPESGTAADAAAVVLWTQVAIDPHGSAATAAPALRQVADASPGVNDLMSAGGAAWLIDETALAIRLLRAAVDRLQAPGLLGASGSALSALGWAYCDAGRWDDALQTAAQAADLAAVYPMDIVGDSADLTTATILALRADRDEARRRALRALAGADLEESRAVTARARYALGMAALADGSFLMAFRQLRQLFSDDGEPLHYHCSAYGLADLAAAAVRADRRLEGRAQLGPALGILEGTSSPRLRQLAGRARGILAEPPQALAHFEAALADPAGEHWPFERAQLQLDCGEAMRRARRINDAKPLLLAALDTFRRLRARAWAHRAEIEVRACGLSVPGLPAPDGLSELTPQQRQIVLLAARGMTNREIGDRLFLSPRTVSSHLYRCFPKLGVADRHQLRDVVTSAASAGGAAAEG
jgi:DNA-binding CsgD family transcriptional regulator